MKKDNNIQIVYTHQFNPYLLVKWQKEQIEVGLLSDLDVQYVEGPSFGFYYRDSKMKRFSYTKHNIERVWQKTGTDNWVKLWTSLKSSNQDIQISDNVLYYSRDYVLYSIDIMYDLKTQKGSGTIFPYEKYIIKWISIFNPSVRRIKEKEFKF